jgi:hypothetical protein
MSKVEVLGPPLRSMTGKLNIFGELLGERS